MTTKGTIFAFLLLCGAGCGPDIGHVALTATAIDGGEGRVRSNPEGISCGTMPEGSSLDVCSTDLGHVFSLIAEPAAGSHFDHWEGDELCTGGSATLVFGKAPDHTLTCTAVFSGGASPPPGSQSSAP